MPPSFALFSLVLLKLRLLLLLILFIENILIPFYFFFFFNDTATTEIYTLSLHDALPISIGAAINERLQMHGGDGAVFFHASFEIHQDGMAAAMAVENFFACEADFYGAVQKERGSCYHDLVIEGIGLAAEAAAVGSGDDADVRGRHLQDFGERAVDVVGRLRAGPNGEFAVGVFDG